MQYLWAAAAAVIGAVIGYLYGVARPLEGGVSALALIGFGIIILIVLGFAAIVLLGFARQTIDLTGLIAEPQDPAVPGSTGGKASLSRFQLLLFTFVTAGLFLLLSIEHGAFVEIPETVLGLIGISSGSFLVSKGISKSGTTSQPGK